MKRISEYVEEYGRDYAESLAAVSVYILGGVVAGSFMLLGRNVFRRRPELLVIIPPLQDLKGNLYSSLGSRVSTKLHLGLIRPVIRDRRLMEDLLASMASSMSMNILIGVVGYVIANAMGFSVSPFFFVSLALLSSLLIFAFLFPVTIAASIYSFRRGLDPDNVVAPLVQTLGDMITLPSLFLVLWILSPGTEIIAAAVLAIAASAALLAAARRAPRVTGESLFALMLSALIDIAAGYVLVAKSESFLGSSGFIGIVPAFIGSAGAIGSILAAKLSTGLHLGEIKAARLPGKRALELMLLTVLLVPPIYAFVGIAGYGTASLMGLRPPGLLPYIEVALTAGLLSRITAIATYYLAVAAWRIGLDPDNVVIPLLTSIFDVINIFILYYVIVWLGYS